MTQSSKVTQSSKEIRDELLKPSLVSPKRIDFEKGYFLGASGKKYVFLDSLPIDYWIQYQMLIPEVTYGNTLAQVMKNNRLAYEALTTGNEIMASHRKACDILFNQMSMLKKFGEESRIPPVLRMAALWIVTEDEELKEYDPRIAEAKIEDWKAAGYAMQDFFLFVAQKIENFKEIYLEFHNLEKSLEEKVLPTSALTNS